MILRKIAMIIAVVLYIRHHIIAHHRLCSPPLKAALSTFNSPTKTHSTIALRVSVVFLYTCKLLRQ